MEQNLTFFKNIVYINNIDSTNTLLKIGNYPDRTACYTFDQTGGRGREEKLWRGFENKCMAFSFLLKDVVFPSTLWFVAAASLALTDILENDFKIKDAWIKWPNDVYISDKKIAGILAETSISENKIKKLVVGIGINISCDQSDLETLENKATSLLIESKKNIEMKDFFEMYLERISEKLNILLFNEKGISLIKDEWIAKSKIIGKNVEWINAGKVLQGRSDGVTDNGFLLLKINNESVTAISGEVKVLN